MSASNHIPKPLDSLAIATLAQEITYLKYASEIGGRVVHDDGSIEKEGKGPILKALQSLTEDLETYGLCKFEVPELKYMVAAFEKKYAKGYSRTLDAADHERLKSRIDRVEALFQDVLVERNFSETTPTVGLLNYKKLLVEGAGGLFRDSETVEALPKIVTEDISDAIRCLAFDIPTPSVMISLRATEGMLREAYCWFYKKEPPDAWAETSSQLFQKLKDLKIETADIEGYLRHIKAMRNSAEHPDQRFSVKEAEDLLMHSQYAIVELLKLRPHAKLEGLENIA